MRVLNRSVIVAGCLGIVAVIAPSFAQKAPTAPAAPAQPAAPTFTPSHLQIAREVLIASGITGSFDLFAPRIVDQAKQSIGSQRPELIKDLDEVGKAVLPQLADSRNEMIDIGTRIYASRLTEDELKSISAFFKTPAGAKYIATQSPILEDLFSQMQGWAERLGARTLELFRVELKKRGHEIN